MTESSNIIAVLLDVKEQELLDVSDELIKECYEIQKKFQFDPNRNTVDKMRSLVELSISEEGEDKK